MNFIAAVVPSTRNRNPSADVFSFPFLPDQIGISFSSSHHHLANPMCNFCEDDFDLPTQASWILSIPSSSSDLNFTGMVMGNDSGDSDDFFLMFIFLSGNFHSHDFFFVFCFLRFLLLIKVKVAENFFICFAIFLYFYARSRSKLYWMLREF